jgi:hypothetical protein
MASGEITCELRLAWAPLGSIRKDLDEKIQFPPAESRCGVYRFLVHRSDGSEAVYVGEAENLQRRFAHYRNPGPSQLTNQRINALVADVLSLGGSVDVEIVTDKAWIRTSAGEQVADLSRKDVRRLFENFILATQNVARIEDLNR